mmetsp:Transcript_14798/g.22289  ORF Transcript_14798/g.22289 Transcript_14798/m.22289 type:complete len:267 (+) Transcript_14798:73-873(+)
MVSFKTVYLVSLLFFAVSAKKPTKKPSNKDGPHIACDVCNNAVDNLFEAVKDARSKAPYQKLDEGEIQDIIDSICKNDDPNGEWIRRLDIVEKLKEKGTFLELDEPGGVSKCGVECQTITKSCDDLFENDIDADELSAMLWKNKLSKKEAKKTVCREWSNRCSKKAKPITFVREDEQFVEMSDKDLQMEQLMAQMNAAGMGGMSMYNRDDMEDMVANGGFGGMGGDYDDYGDGGLDPEMAGGYGGFGDMGAGFGNADDLQNKGYEL